jgi:probable F420-dependent oxidoreductase
MKIGIVFPQTEFGSDPAALKDYAQTAESVGFNHIVIYEHVLGVNPDRPGGWKGYYSFHDPFLEPFVLYGYMAAFTRRLGLVTGILVLPQRQTALVAKQAATLDVLCGGRLRLGVAVGWNALEYQGMGSDFHTRGRRFEEQIALLRQLWSEPVVTFDGRWDHIPDAGINQLPVQRPIPLWFGGHADSVIERAVRLADGWMPTYRSAPEAAGALEKLDQALARAGRDRTSFGIEGRGVYSDSDIEAVGRLIEGWEAAGATHFSINTMRGGLDGAAAHLRAVRELGEQLLGAT